MRPPIHATGGQIAVFWAARIISVLVCLFLLMPILIFVPLSFSAGTFFHYPLPGFSLRWYQDLLSSSFWLPSLVNSIIVGSCATMLATILGVLAAFGFWRSHLPGRGALIGLLVSPMVVPVIITAASTYYAYAPFHLTNSFIGLILAHTAIAVPFVLINVLATLSSFNEDYLRAAANLGAGPLVAFRRVVLPLIAPGVASGAVFALAVSFDDVVIALFLAGPQQRTLPRQMFTASVDNFSLTITAAATVMIVLSTCLLVAIQLLKRRSEHIAAGGH